ncbi:unnamed protein product [Urochloa humidicola]
MRCAWRRRAAAAPVPGGGDPLGRAAAKASSAFPRWLMLSHHRQEPELVGCRGRPIGPLWRRRLEAKVHLGAQRRRIGAPAAASSRRTTACYSTAALTATLPLGPRGGGLVEKAGAARSRRDSVRVVRGGDEFLQRLPAVEIPPPTRIARPADGPHRRPKLFLKGHALGLRRRRPRGDSLRQLILASSPGTQEMQRRQPGGETR